MIKNESVTFKKLTNQYYLEKIKSQQSFLLLGPRQTGKTTQIQQLCQQYQGPTLTYPCQLPSVRQRLEHDPEVIVREVDALLYQQQSEKQRILVWIDEIQKVPLVMDVLQFLLDQQKIILIGSGSSARSMRRLGANWLPGRIMMEYAYPLSYWEVNASKPLATLDEILLYGSLPQILSRDDRQLREQQLHAYTQLYLEEEIRAEALARDIPRFNRFLQLAALESGSAPNKSKIAQQVGMTHTSISTYFEILRDTLIIFELPAFGMKRSQVVTSSKYYFFDMGVRQSAAQLGHDLGLLTLEKGRLFEHWVMIEVQQMLKGRANLSYWRTKQHQEVDLIVEYKKTLIAIEIKSTHRPQSADFKSLSLFAEQYRPEHSLMICFVVSEQQFGPHLALPWQQLRSWFQQHIGLLF